MLGLLLTSKQVMVLLERTNLQQQQVVSGAALWRLQHNSSIAAAACDVHHWQPQIQSLHPVLLPVEENAAGAAACCSGNSRALWASSSCPCWCC